MKLIVDGNNFAYRCAAVKELTNSRGENVTILHGFVTMLHNLVKTHYPEEAIVCFDSGGSRARLELFAEYKGERDPDDPFKKEVNRQLTILRDWLKYFKVKCMALEGIECDDIVYLLSRALTAKGGEVTVVSSDSDLLQCINDRVHVLSPRKGIIYTPKVFESEFGFPVENYLDYKCMVGDKGSDNIPGVSGIGEKTAKELVSKYGKYEEIIQHREEITAHSRTSKILLPGVQEIMERNRKLIRLGSLVSPEERKTIAQTYLSQKVEADINKIQEYCDMYELFELSTRIHTLFNDFDLIGANVYVSKPPTSNKLF